MFDEILHEEAREATRLNTAVPTELQRIIDKAIEKDRNLRYHTAADPRTDLKRLKRDTSSGRVGEGEWKRAAPRLQRLVEKKSGPGAQKLQREIGGVEEMDGRDGEAFGRHAGGEERSLAAPTCGKQARDDGLSCGGRGTREGGRKISRSCGHAVQQC